MSLTIPTIEDFQRLESKLDRCLTLLNAIIVNTEVQRPTSILSVKDVEDEFKQSPYNQRVARNTGKLKFMPSGRDIHYNRSDVEEWMKTKII